MSQRIFTALGTASQVPTRSRNHNGYFLDWDEEGFLFDPGEGTQRQMIFAGVSASRVDKVCITHFHGDHCLGLAGLIQRFSLDRVEHPIHIFYPASGQVFLERLRHASHFHETAKLVLHPIKEAGVIFEGKNYVLETHQLSHTVDCWGYRLVENDSQTMLPKKLASLGIKGPDIGRLIRQGSLEVDGRSVSLAEVSEPKKGQSFAFVMDTRMCKGGYELAKEVDLLVCESTYLDSEREEAVAHGHLTAKQAARLANRSHVRRLVLTHFSQRYPHTGPFLAEAKQIHEDVVVVRDGDRVDVPSRLTPEEHSG